MHYEYLNWRFQLNVTNIADNIYVGSCSTPTACFLSATFALFSCPARRSRFREDGFIRAVSRNIHPRDEAILPLHEAPPKQRPDLICPSSRAITGVAGGFYLSRIVEFDCLWSVI